jgi:hypothetical protein
MHRDGLSYRLIGRDVGLSKNNVMEIVRRGAIPWGDVSTADDRHSQHRGLHTGLAGDGRAGAEGNGHGAGARWTAPRERR